jgi:hypothetical protein
MNPSSVLLGKGCLLFLAQLKTAFMSNILVIALLPFVGDGHPVAFKDGAKKVNLSLRAIWPAKSWEVSP